MTTLGSDAFTRRAAALLNEWSIPGVAAVVAERGETLHELYLGTLDATTGLSVAADSLFPLGSSTKSLTALAALRLVERGLIDLDAPAASYLAHPSLERPALQGVLTLRNLLGHRTGLGGKGLYERGWLRTRDRLDHLATAELAASPGSSFNYLNMHYLLAGELVAAVTGEPIEQSIARLVFVPLGMHGACFLPDVPEDAKRARPHGYGDTGPVRIDEINNGTRLAADGAYASPRDLTRYLGALSASHAPGGALFAGETWVAFQSSNTPVTEPVRSWYFRFAEDPVFGLGWYCSRHRRQAVFYSSGRMMGLECILNYLPDRNITLVILANCSVYCTGPHPALQALQLLFFDAVLEIEARDYASAARTWYRERMASVEASLRAAVPAHAASMPKARLGRYRSKAYGELTMIANGNAEVRLRVETEPTEFRLVPTTDLNRFGIIYANPVMERYNRWGNNIIFRPTDEGFAADLMGRAYFQE